MKQVAITLEPEIAAAYLKANQRVQKKAVTLINLWLKDIFVKKKNTRKELWDAIDEASRIAKKNGLTPEILQQILNERA